MQVSEAADVIEAMAESYRRNPSQFHFAVTVNQVGTSVQANGGGIGMQVSVSGGAPGSKTVGFVSSAGSGSVDASVVRQAAGAEIQQQANAAIDLFNALAAELRSARPQKESVSGILSKMATAMLPPLVVAAVKVLLAKAGIEI